MQHSGTARLKAAQHDADATRPRVTVVHDLDPERYSYSNLILLCPTHHTLVDKAVEDHPVERLHLLKDDHEQWVRERLTVENVADSPSILHAHIVDVVSESARLAEWDKWVGWAVSPEHHWRPDSGERFVALYRTIQKTPWPGKLPELESATKTLATVLVTTVNLFLEHSEDAGDILKADKFYKRADSDEAYHRRVHVFEAWSGCCDEMLCEATRAANWFAEAVRSRLNPMFFLLEGKFSAVEQIGLMRFRSTVYEYPGDVRAALPETLDARLAALCKPYTDVRE